LYVTLEPCCHQGRTPPCTEAIIQHGISKVVYGSSDPNPLVSGKGAEQLRRAGIEVTEGFLKEECDALNTIFFHYITTGMPYTAVKFAMTLDGKIATVSGKSKWITGDIARQHVHMLRNKYAAILVGIGTVLADDPMLNCRIPGGHDPLRVICDSHLRIPEGSQICRSAKDIPTLIAYCDDPHSRRDMLEDMGIQLLHIPDENGRVDMCRLLTELGKMKTDSVLAEGGGAIHDSLMATGLSSHVYAYIAPKIFGGAVAKSPVLGAGVEDPAECAHLTNLKTTMLGEDILLEYDIQGGYRKNVYRHS
jgi:diaminohydroxyphosphoribosylaminopyrimidine deaminase/5-amino-6-(5-phosphoribosylamino)uracil reductase